MITIDVTIEIIDEILHFTNTIDSHNLYCSVYDFPANIHIRTSRLVGYLQVRQAARIVSAIIIIMVSYYCFGAAVAMQMQAEINSHNFSQSTIKFSLSHCTLVPRTSYLGPWAKPLAG